jgi:hypothetical protein
MKYPTEHAEQVTFVCEFERRFPGVRIFAIPNGGYRSKVTAANLKAEGVKKGVPDLFIPEWDLWVEMKRIKGGSLSADQKDWIAYLQEIGHTVIVGKGWQGAMEQVEEFRA